MLQCRCHFQGRISAVHVTAMAVYLMGNHSNLTAIGGPPVLMDAKHLFLVRLMSEMVHFVQAAAVQDVPHSAHPLLCIPLQKQSKFLCPLKEAKIQGLSPFISLCSMLLLWCAC